MIVIYREATGQVVDNSGTNSLYPAGDLPEDLIWINTPDRTGLAYVRLHDVDDAPLVAAVFAGHARIENGRVIDGTPVAPPEPSTPAPTVDDALTQLAALQAWALEWQDKATSIQDQVDQLTLLMGSGL